MSCVAELSSSLAVGADYHPGCTRSFKFSYLRPPVSDYPPAPAPPASAAVEEEEEEETLEQALERQASAVDLLREENGACGPLCGELLCAVWRHPKARL
jgi:hypothetical protein